MYKKHCLNRKERNLNFKMACCALLLSVVWILSVICVDKSLFMFLKTDSGNSGLCKFQVQCCYKD